MSAVLLAVAEELAEQAKNSLPEIQKGERIRREWLENGVYSRETVLNGEICLCQYDFRQRVGHQVSTGVVNGND